MATGRKPSPVRNGKATKTSLATAERQAELIPKATRILTPPQTLSVGAKKEWRRVLRVMEKCDIDLITDLDTQILAAYCMEVDIRDTLYRQWQTEQNCAVTVEDLKETASKDMDADGETTRMKVSTTKASGINPILAQINKHNQTIRVLAEQLGLTPVGRAAYAVRTEKKARNKAEELMDFFDGDADGDGDGYRDGYGALS